MGTMIAVALAGKNDIGYSNCVYNQTQSSQEQKSVSWNNNNKWKKEQSDAKTISSGVNC
jgi:hypothetical protein